MWISGVWGCKRPRREGLHGGATGRSLSDGWRWRCLNVSPGPKRSSWRFLLTVQRGVVGTFGGANRLVFHSLGVCGVFVETDGYGLGAAGSQGSFCSRLLELFRALRSSLTPALAAAIWRNQCWLWAAGTVVGAWLPGLASTCFSTVPTSWATVVSTLHFWSMEQTACMTVVWSRPPK